MFSATQEEAAKAYDSAAMKYRGAAALTNFRVSNYSKTMDANINCSENMDANSPTDNSPPSKDELNDDMKPQQQEDEGLLSEIQNLMFEQDNPWSLNMELGDSYTPDVFSDDLFYKSGDHLDLFSDHGFEASIDSIFGKPVSNNG